MDKTINICQTCLSRDRKLFPLIHLRDTVQEINIWQLRDLRGCICWECRSVMVGYMKFKLQVCLAQRLLSETEQIEDLKCLSRLQTQLHSSHSNRPKCDPLTNLDEKSELVIIKEECHTVNDTIAYETNSDDDKEIENGHADEKNARTNETDASSKEIEQDFYSVMFKEDSTVNKNIKKKKCTIKNITSNDIFNSNTDNPITDADLKAQTNSDKKTDVGMIKEETDNINEDKKYDIKNLNCNNHKKKNYVKRKKSRRRIDIRDTNKRKRFTESDESDSENVNDKFSIIVFTEEEMLKNREEKRMQPNFKKIQYKCDMCVLGFTKKDNYDTHMQKKHDKSIGEFSCNICQIRYTNEVDVEQHRRQHYVCFRCKLCKYEVSQMWAVLNHCRSKHRGDTYNNIHCKQCDLVAKTPEDLAEHIKKIHMLECDECGGRFKGKHTLRSHKVRIHTLKREFICDVCTKTFTKKSRLESHMVTHDGALAKQLAYCTTCKVQYKNIYIYRGHLKNSTNHSERAYACVECNKKFSSRAYWMQHYNFYHLQKSQFICEQCDKLFISDWRLKNHKQKYHGLDRPRDHQCNECGKKFFTLATLRSHQLTHSEQRSYMCEDCGDTFKQRPALYTHTRLVHQGVKRKKSHVL